MPRRRYAESRVRLVIQAADCQRCQGLTPLLSMISLKAMIAARMLLPLLIGRLVWPDADVVGLFL